MEKISKYRVYLDGIDKSGKDLICSYITELGRYKYLVKSRGIMSMIVYSRLNNREYEYDLTNEKNVINILLTVDYFDWKVRCKVTNEKDVNEDDYFTHTYAFNDVRSELLQLGCIIPCYNTSYHTAYQIAKDILKNLERLERGEAWTIEL